MGTGETSFLVSFMVAWDLPGAHLGGEQGGGAGGAVSCFLSRWEPPWEERRRWAWTVDLGGASPRPHTFRRALLKAGRRPQRFKGGQGPLSRADVAEAATVILWPAGQTPHAGSPRPGTWVPLQFPQTPEQCPTVAGVQDGLMDLNE